MDGVIHFVAPKNSSRSVYTFRVANKIGLGKGAMG
jgi:hypothetical protein